MNKEKLVSIIIPVYNAGKYIEKNLNRILNQTYKNIEIILVDDGSTDNSIEICKKIKNKNYNVKIFSKKNGGPSSARNFGLKKSSGELVFFCDSDDYIDSTAIETLVNLYRNDSSKLYGLSIKNLVNNKLIEVKQQKLNYTKNSFYRSIFNQSVLGGVCRFLFDRKKINNMKFDINTKCMEDTIFLIEYINNNSINDIRFVNNQYYYYVSNSNSLTNKKNGYEKCCNYAYSLNIINRITAEEFFNDINDNLVRIIESELDKKIVTLYKKDIYINLKIKKYNGNNLRYKFFSIIFIYKKVHLLKFYYTVKQLIKLVKRGVCK